MKQFCPNYNIFTSTTGMEWTESRKLAQDSVTATENNKNSMGIASKT